MEDCGKSLAEKLVCVCVCVCVCVFFGFGGNRVMTDCQPFCPTPKQRLSKKNIYITEISVKWGKDSTSNPEFGHSQGEIDVWSPEFHPVFSFFLSASTAAMYIEFHCSYPTLKPPTLNPKPYNHYNSSSHTLCMKCWDSAFRTEFQHFMLRFNKISLLYQYH
jgi:hypothetical protein